MITISSIIILLLLGAFVGIVAGMFGIGGGGILVPILTMIFLKNNVPQELAIHMALATSMCSIIITSFSSFRSHNKKNNVAWNLFWLIAPGIVIGTFSGAFIASKISSFYLAIIFSAFMFCSSMRMFFLNPKTGTKKMFSKIVQFIAGLFIGIISAIVSIGGGVLSVPFISSQGIDIKKAIGTSAAIGFPLAISGTIGYIFSGWAYTSLENFTLGYVNIFAVVFTTITSYFFAPIGVKIINKISSKNVRKIFAILPFVLSIKMLFEVI